jgi:hypothetical protein
MLLIRKEMLDDSNAAKEKTDAVKKELHELLQPEKAEEIADLWPHQEADPGELVQDIIVAMRRLREIMRKNFKVLDIDAIQAAWCCYESPTLFYERWEKIFGEFADGGRADFDPSKVSELYDSLKYDALHNRTFLEKIFVDADADDGMRSIRELYSKAKLLFDFISPLEYGISEEDRLEIGLLTSMPLIKQIVEDLESCKRPDAAPCTKLYFTKGKHWSLCARRWAKGNGRGSVDYSLTRTTMFNNPLESHVHTLLNVVYLSGIPTRISKNMIPELDCKSWLFDSLKSCPGFQGVLRLKSCLLFRAMS